MSDQQTQNENSPSGAESNQPFDNFKAKIAQKMLRVVEMTAPIVKGDKGTQDWYYASSEDVLVAIRANMVTAKLAFYMNPIGQPVPAEVKGVSGMANIWMQTFVMHLVDAETGYDLSFPWNAQCLILRDDKAENKMETNAQKTFLVRTFLVPTKDAVDTDSNPTAEQVERRNQQRAQKAQKPVTQQQGQPTTQQGQQRQGQPSPQQQQPQQQQPQQQQRDPQPQQKPQQQQPQQQRSNEVSFEEAQRIKFFEEMTQRGFNMNDDEERRKAKALLDRLGFPGKYDPAKHDGMLEAIDAYLKQKKSGMEQTIDEFMDEGSGPKAGESSPPPEDDGMFEFTS